MSNNRYTEEFRVEAVRQVVERGHSVAEVASRLGVIILGYFMMGMLGDNAEGVGVDTMLI